MMNLSPGESVIVQASDTSPSDQNLKGRSKKEKMTAADVKALPESDLLWHFPNHDQIPHNIETFMFSNHDNDLIQQDIVTYHLKTDLIRVSNSSLPFCKQKNFPRASQVMSGFFDSSQISTCFPNVQTAETYIRNSARRSLRRDLTVPTDPEMQRVFVAILKHAFQSTALAEDREQYIDTFESAFHDPRIVEYHCWKLFNAIIDRAKSGVPVSGAYGSSTAIPRNHYDSFCDLFDAVRYALQCKKTLCNQILDSPDVVKLADDPMARYNKSMENQDVNDQKRKDIVAGRRVRVEAGEVAPPKKRARIRRYTPDSEAPSSDIVDGIRKYSKVPCTDYFAFDKDGGRTLSISQTPTSFTRHSQFNNTPCKKRLRIPVSSLTTDHQGSRNGDLINTGTSFQFNPGPAGDGILPSSLFAESTTGPQSTAPDNTDKYGFATLSAYDDLFHDASSTGLRGGQNNIVTPPKPPKHLPTTQGIENDGCSIWCSGRGIPGTSSRPKRGYQEFKLDDVDSIQDLDNYLG